MNWLLQRCFWGSHLQLCLCVQQQDSVLPQCTVLAGVCSQHRNSNKFPETKKEQLLTLPPQTWICPPPPTFCSSNKEPAYCSVWHFMCSGRCVQQCVSSTLLRTACAVFRSSADDRRSTNRLVKSVAQSPVVLLKELWGRGDNKIFLVSAFPFFSSFSFLKQCNYEDSWFSSIIEELHLVQGFTFRVF